MTKDNRAEPVDEGHGRSPVLDAYEDGTCWRVWCRYCQQWHRHSRGAGHRVAHCIAADSPYRATGYTLRDAGPFTEAVSFAHGLRSPWSLVPGPLQRTKDTGQGTRDRRERS